MCPLHLGIALHNILDSALEAAQARHKYKREAQAAGETVTWKASGEDDDDDAKEAIPEEQLERTSDTASGYVGVYAHGNGWQAECTVGGKKRRIGSFPR